MLGFLKKLFGGGLPAAPEAPSAVTVALADLDSWLVQQREPLQAKLAEQLATAQARIGGLSALTREKVQVLQNAQLMNPDIPDRAKDFMSGNREEYSRRVLQYVETIALPNAAEALPSFFERHAQDAQAFTQGILRPFQILQEFFSHESKEITAVLADMEREIALVRDAHAQSKIDQYRTLRTDIEQLIARRQQLRGLQSERADLAKQRAESEQSLRVLNAEEERLLKDAARQAALQKGNEAHQRVVAHEQKIKDVFANFEPALRKFNRMATRNVKLTEHYLRDPVQTLMEDLHLDVLDVIADIQRLMTFDRLQMGDKKPFVLDAMSLLNKEFLGKWMSEYGRLSKAEKEAQSAVENCEASKTLGRIQRLRDETRRTAQVNEQRLAQVERDITRVNLDELKAKLEQKLKDIAGKIVTITC